MTPFVNDMNFHTVTFKSITVGDFFWCNGKCYLKIKVADIIPNDSHVCCKSFNAFNLSDNKFEWFLSSTKVLFCYHLTVGETLPDGLIFETTEEFQKKLDELNFEKETTGYIEF